MPHTFNLSDNFYSQPKHGGVVMDGPQSLRNMGVDNNFKENPVRVGTPSTDPPQIPIPLMIGAVVLLYILFNK